MSTALEYVSTDALRVSLDGDSIPVTWACLDVGVEVSSQGFHVWVRRLESGKLAALLTWGHDADRVTPPSKPETGEEWSHAGWTWSNESADFSMVMES